MLTLLNQDISIAFDPEQNTCALNLPGFLLRDCSAGIRIDGKVVSDFVWEQEASDESSLTLRCQNQAGDWKLVFVCKNNSITIALSGQIAPNARKIELIPLSMPRLEADHMLLHGRRMGGCALFKLPVAEEQTFVGAFQHLITSNEHTLQISHPLKQKHLSTITGKITGHEIRDLEVLSPVEFHAGGWVAADPVTIASGMDGHALMSAWAEENRPSDIAFIKQEAGWNSWDYYRWTVTEDEVLANAEFIVSDPVLSKHVTKIIVDDGWQYCYGEWDANPLFPGGMEKLAATLEGMGFQAGLWFAPTIIEPHCRIAQWDTDMLAMGESGLPCMAYECMKRVGFVLDPTREKVRQWLHDLFARYADMGYSYFKLDFLWQTFKAPRFYEARAPKGDIMRRILEPIRAATKGRADILGCNYHFEGGPDMVDAVRVSGDIHPMWKSVQRNSVPIACRFWSHKRLWLNDPDFSVIRGRDTSDDPDLNRLKPNLVGNTPQNPDPGALNNGLSDLSYEEAKTLLSIVVVSDGVRNLSDKLPLLNERGLDLLRRAVAAPYGEAGVPLDLFATDAPARYLQKIPGGVRVLLINWSDEDRECSLNLNDHGVNVSTAVNFWTDEPVAIQSGVVRAALKPHACLLAVISQ